LESTWESNVNKGEEPRGNRNQSARQKCNKNNPREDAQKRQFAAASLSIELPPFLLILHQCKSQNATRTGGLFCLRTRWPTKRRHDFLPHTLIGIGRHHDNSPLGRPCSRMGNVSLWHSPSEDLPSAFGGVITGRCIKHERSTGFIAFHGFRNGFAGSVLFMDLTWLRNNPTSANKCGLPLRSRLTLATEKHPPHWTLRLRPVSRCTGNHSVLDVMPMTTDPAKTHEEVQGKAPSKGNRRGP